MVVVLAEESLVFTAAPGTGSTALREVLLARGAAEVPPPGAPPVEGVDPKHGTVRELLAAGAMRPDHGMRVVTTTRNPFDFYVAEHARNRRRWVHELRDPTSWVFSVPGAVDRIVDAVTLDFGPWLAQAIGDPARPRRLNEGHVEEADVVLRMEHLETDLRYHLGLDLRVPATNVTDRDREWWRHYDAAGRRLVEQSHAADLERFGFTF